MKEIKFRVWMPDYNQMIYPHLDDFIRNKEGMVIGKLNIGFKYNFGLEFDMTKAIPPLYENQIGDFDKVFYDINHVIQQFTGLHDINNKDIYDGDILESFCNQCSFTYLPEDKTYYFPVAQTFIGDWVAKDTNLEREYTLAVILDDDCFASKIVGNILENPQLISPKT